MNLVPGQRRERNGNARESERTLLSSCEYPLCICCFWCVFYVEKLFLVAKPVVKQTLGDSFGMIGCGLTTVSTYVDRETM